MTVPGVFRGVCVDSKDPQGLGRVRVQVPQVLGGSASGWAFPAWGLGDLAIWPEDRLPKPGQGVWVAFENTDRMVWLAAFGPQEFSLQRLDDVLDSETGLPVAYETLLDWRLPVLPEDTVVPITGTLTSLSGPLAPEEIGTVHLERSADQALWDRVASTQVVGTDWSFDYSRAAAEVGWWYRVVFDGSDPYWPGSTPEEQIAVPAAGSVLTWDGDTATPKWQFPVTVSGTLLDDQTDPVVGEEVRIYRRTAGNPWSLWGSATTDATGGWSATLTWEGSLVTGFEAQAVYNGSAAYDYADTSGNRMVVADPAIPVLIPWSFPEEPDIGSRFMVSGSIATTDYAPPTSFVRSLQFQISTPQTPAWTTIATAPVERSGSWMFSYTLTEPNATYRMYFPGAPPFAASTSTEEYRLVVLDTSLAAPAMPVSPVQGGQYSVTGTVRDERNVSATSGTVRLEYRYSSETEDDWRTAAPTASVGSNGVYSISVPKLDFLGSSLWRVQYLGDGVFYNPSTSTSTTRIVGLAQVASLTKGTVTHSSAAVSWSAVPGAVDYQLWVDGSPTIVQSETSYTFSGLSQSTTYSFEVQARGTDVDSNAVIGARSPVAKANTGRVEIRQSGSFTNHDEIPTVTGTYRPADGWTYNGSTVVQGYYSVSDRRGSGVMTYNGAGFRSWLAGYTGRSDVGPHLSFNYAAIRMYRISGGGGTDTMWWYVSPATAQSGGDPPRAGGGSSGSLAIGSNAWVSLPAPHWAKHILMNETINCLNANGTTTAQTIRSAMIRRDNSTEYAKFGGKGYATQACYLRVSATWNFAIQTYIAPRWL